MVTRSRIAVALADGGSFQPNCIGGVGVAARVGLEPEGNQEVAALDAVATRLLEQPVAAAEPAGRPGAFAAHEEVVPDPPGAARCAGDLVGVQVAVMGTLESADIVVVATEHVRRSGEQLQILRLQQIVLVGL